jgi:hypothetical protein
MWYNSPKNEFDGLRCSLDEQTAPSNVQHATADKIAFVLLGSALLTMLVTGTVSLITKDYQPVLAAWVPCGPILTLIMRRYLGPFHGWNKDDG